MQTTTLPYGSDARAHFANARKFQTWEGGCAYAAERDGFAYVIIDEGTMAEFLDETDADLRDQLIQVHKFDSEVDRDAYLQRRIARAEGVEFFPWVGDRYAATQANLRLLVLGESHYSKEPPDEDFTRRLTGKYVAGTWTHRFWTVLARTINDRNLSLADCRNFWQSVVFYNYIQTFVGERARVRPTREMWESARRPFLHVLREHVPTAVLVIGQGLWDNLPEAKPGTISLEDGTSWPTKTYEINASTRVVATYIKHPASRGFSRTKWSAVVNALRAETRAP